jgi:hypothetical protein
MMGSDLYRTNTLSWIFIVLSHWNNSPRIDMSPHSNILSCFAIGHDIAEKIGVLALSNNNAYENNNKVEPRCVHVKGTNTYTEK